MEMGPLGKELYYHLFILSTQSREIGRAIFIYYFGLRELLHLREDVFIGSDRVVVLVYMYVYVGVCMYIYVYLVFFSIFILIQ